MNLALSEDQQILRQTFARFLSEQSSTARVRAAAASDGFDRALWSGLADLGTFSLRVPEDAEGMELGLLDAVVVMEEAGRALASGPVAEMLVATRVLAAASHPTADEWLQKAIAGQAVVTFALHEVTEQPMQWIAGGAVADAVIARAGAQVVLIAMPPGVRGEATLAATSLAELDLRQGERTVLSEAAAGGAFAQGVEEWKLLMAAALLGLACEAVHLAAAYAKERIAFGQPIGSYQAISHPLADLVAALDAGRYLLWKTIDDIAQRMPHAGAKIPLTLWWSIETAGRAVAQALHTFGGYGLTTDYDIHLFNLRAKAWPLVLGDPARLLEEAGRRLYANERAALPEAGAVSIDFDLGEDAHRLAAEVDEFFTRTLTPELRAKAHFSWDGHDAGVHRQLGAAHLLYPSWPPEWGGRNAGPYAMAAISHVWEAQGWGHHAASTTAMVGAIIRRFGSEELKREVLTKIVAGEALCNLGYSEPGCGSDVFAAVTRATREGDGWRIDGQKMFTSGANIANYVLLLTRTNPDVPKHKGLTLFIVPLDAPGVSVQPVFTFQDERTNVTYYDGVRVDDTYRLGDVDGGVKVMASALELEHGAGFAKTQEHMVQAAEQLCREIDYDGRPLIERAATQARLARAWAHVFLSEVLGHRALWAAVESQPNLAYGPMAKLFSSEMFKHDAADLLDLTAPHSLSKRPGPAAFLNQCFRHSQATTIYGGTSEIHRSLIAEKNLGLPRSRA